MHAMKTILPAILFAVAVMFCAVMATADNSASVDAGEDAIVIAEPDVAVTAATSKHISGKSSIYGPKECKPVKIEGEKSFGKARYDIKNRVVTISGKIKTRDTKGEPVELFCATNDSERLYETIIACDVRPLDLHKALVAIGLAPSGYAAQKDEVVDILGDKVALCVEWSNKGKRYRIRAEDMFLDTRFNRTWERWGWVFVGTFGSYFDRQKGKDVTVYRPDVEKSLVVNYHSPNAVLDNPRALGAFDDIFRTNKDVIPPVGTSVDLVFRPISETEIIKGIMEDAQHISNEINAYLLSLSSQKKPIPKDLVALSQYYSDKKTWYAGVLVFAEKIDAEKTKLTQDIFPKIKALKLEQTKAEKAGDKSNIAKLKRKGAIMLAEADRREKHMNILYHELWTQVSNRELSEGKKKKVAKSAMDILVRMKDHYAQRERLVQYYHSLSKVQFEIIQINSDIESLRNAAEKKTAQRRLVELETDRDVLRRKIEGENARIDLRKQEQVVALVKKQMQSDDVKNDPDTLKSYKKDLDKQVAKKNQCERYIKLAVKRIAVLELRGKLRLAEFDGKTEGVDELKKEIAARQKEEREVGARIQMYDLQISLEEAEWQLRLSISAGDERDVIERLRVERDAIRARIAELSKLLEEQPGK